MRAEETRSDGGKQGRLRIYRKDAKVAKGRKGMKILTTERREGLGGDGEDDFD